jgi:hypothetical protein
MIYPVDPSSPVTQCFGENPQDYARFGLPGHNGIDFAVRKFTVVVAALPGKVLEVKYDANGYGHYVKLLHSAEPWKCDATVMTLYAHLEAPSVVVGQVLAQGDQVGVSGSTGNSTGPHLHFELRISNKAVDPEPYLNGTASLPLKPGADLPAPTAFTAKVLPEVLNVRSGPALCFPVVTQLHAGDLVQVNRIARRTVWAELGPSRFVAMEFEGEPFLQEVKSA